MNSGNKPVKSLNVDPRSKNRIRFQSAKQRAKKASADVYRTYKRRVGVTTAASREERVHHQDQFNDTSDKNIKKKRKFLPSVDGEAKAILSGDYAVDDSSDEEMEMELEENTTFAMELDLAYQRNAAIIFGRLHYELAPLIRSLPEILHHAQKIIKILLSYVLSPYAEPSDPSPEESWMHNDSKKKRELFVINMVTTDVLHLLSVLARDLRHEIHPYVHDLILPRLINDLINPPTTIDDPEMKQQRSLDVTVVETAFRTISYIFRYDASGFLAEGADTSKSGRITKKQFSEKEGCLESLRKYYGYTLAHKTNTVRRLGAESFAPLLRKLKSNSSKKKHIRRVIRSLAASASNSASFTEENEEIESNEDCYVPIIVKSTALDRSSNDAIDGVASLLFYTARGVPGRFHSKGQNIVKVVFANLLPVDNSNSAQLDNTDKYKRHVTFQLISEFVRRLREHVHNNGSTFAMVWNELHNYMESSVDALKKDETGYAFSFGHFVQIATDCVNHEDGILLKSNDEADSSVDEEQATKFSKLLHIILEAKFYEKLGKRNQAHVLNLLCSSWKIFCEHPTFSSRLCRFIPTIAEGSDAIVDPIIILAKNLLPFIPDELASNHIIPEVLKAAAKIGRNGNTLRTHHILHAVATSRLSLFDEDDDKDDFFTSNATNCYIPLKVKKDLVQSCLQNLDLTSAKSVEKNELARLGYVARLVPLLAHLECDESDEEDTSNLVGAICKCTMNVLKKLDKFQGQAGIENDFIVAKALIIESLASTASQFAESKQKSAIKKILKACRASANKFLFDFPTSLMVVKASAEIATALKLFDLQINDEANETFDAITRNLRSQNHFMRLHSLRLLQSYPQRPFITDFNEIDLSEDLDEVDFQGKKSGGSSGNLTTSSLSGMCDILETLLHIETTPISLKNDRRLTGAINRIEVFARTGKLPAQYAEAATNHMLGILNIKFRPLWSIAVKAITVLASVHEVTVWPILHSQLESVMKASYFAKNAFETDADGNDDVASDDILDHHSLFLMWDKSFGVNAKLFQHQIEAARQSGRISRHHSTDRMTVFGNVWSVLEGVPKLTTKKSRIIVPIFLRFLHDQYFIFHDDDPDCREFQIHRYISDVEEDSRRSEWTKEKLGRRSIQIKLVSFLRMFSKIKGMEQLYKHKLLLVIFSSFLSNPDIVICQLSLTCVFRFNLPFVKPYEDQLKGMLSKKDFRETLTTFKVSRDGGGVDSAYREDLLPIIIRILFGRLSARGNGTKSSKDSPATRRSYILSFLSGLDGEGKELGYFMYMMVRTFIPVDVDMCIVECGHGSKSHVEEMISHVFNTCSIQEVSSLKVQRQQGFLNLMSDVVKKFGFHVIEFVPVLMKLLLVMLEHTELQRKSASSLDESSTDLNEKDYEVGHSRVGKVRIMCFLRMAELMKQYAGAYSFLDFREKMTKIIQPALQKLPESAVIAENPPSLLLLLETISSHDKLIPLLKHDKSLIEAAFKCISGSTTNRVMDSALKFVHNLLTEGGLYDTEDYNYSMSNTERIGSNLVRENLELLLQQFLERLRSNEGDTSKVSPLASRELSILCRVSVLLADEGTSDEQVADMLASLCNLLMPFLSFHRRISEESQMDVLTTLGSILPRIGDEAAFSHLQSLAKILGPNGSREGIKSLELRQKIICCIGAIAQNDGPMSASLKVVKKALEDLNASDPKHLADWDFDRVLPVLNGLGDEKSSSDNSWFSYCKNTPTAQNGLKVITPLMYSCLHMLYDSDGVLSRGSLKALKCLILIASEQCGTDDAWLWLVERSLMSTIRTGLKNKSDSVRRNFILLLPEVVKRFSSHSSSILCSDLIILVREDNIDLDFFQNITHVQIHRRSRAFTRLRKMLTEDSDSNDCKISSQSLVNIILPLALHPVYESETKKEEAYTLEAIATIGVICKQLPWGKYQGILWNSLVQLSKHEDRERYLIATICSIIDAFHFDVYIEDDSDAQMKLDKSSTNEGKDSIIWNQLNKKFIPKIQSYLMKEVIAHDGEKEKVLRSPVALALTKLFQKLPQSIFDKRFPRVLTIICNTLKGKDSDTRDIARKSLAKIATTVHIRYLADIVRELAMALYEGYRLHVRAATLHSVLLAISATYERLDSTKSSPFDSCVPAMMDIIQQDIFGDASEIKEVEGVKKRLVKEAMGAKSFGSLELISSMILFKPSLHSTHLQLSSIHAIVNPFLERLQDPEVDSKTLSKVKEAMAKIVVGISQNSSSTSEEMLPFVYATVAPYIVTEESFEEYDDMSGSDDEEMKGLEVSRSKPRKKVDKEGASKKNTRKAIVWAPSQLNSANDSKRAHEIKMKDKYELRRVQDGANAPKLTGSSRNESLKSKADLNSPAISCGVAFGLSLLYAHLKRNRSSVNEMMGDPFVKILAICVRQSKDNNAVLLSLKCLQVLLRLDLPSLPMYRKDLSRSILSILSSLSCNTQNEMVQGSFKTLTLLIVTDRTAAIRYLDNEGNDTLTRSEKPDVPKSDDRIGQSLNKGQVQVLVSILQSALTDAEHHNSTFGVIRAITSTKYVSPEYYDLMETIIKMTVQSQKVSMRQQAAKIFLQYLIEYPMGKQRLENHLKQIVLNVQYEYDDGRLSAIELVCTLINKLPLPLLEEYCQLFFLPLVLQLVNDESKKCRESVGVSITALLSRLSISVLQSLYEYAIRWSEDKQNSQLQRMSVQLLGLFLDSRIDFMKKNDRFQNLVNHLSRSLQSEMGAVEHTNVLLAKEWEMVYFCLQTIEKVGNIHKKVLWKDTEMWKTIIKSLVHPHPWVQLVSSRIIFSHLSSCEPNQFSKMIDESASSIILKIPASLFEIARNLCFQLNSEEEHQAQDVTTMAIKNLSWMIQIMHLYPRLCYTDGDSTQLEANESDGEDEDAVTADKKNPCTWLIVRLSNIARKPGRLRREAVFKCFAAFATVCDTDLIRKHLELMIQPLERVLVQSKAHEESLAQGYRGNSYRNSFLKSDGTSITELPTEVLQLLEEKCGTEEFMQAMSLVKSEARDKREARKQRIAAEAVTNPEASAKRKTARQAMKKNSKKRKIDKFKKGRGVFTKKPRHLS